MPYPYHFHEKAYEEFINAYEWFETNQQGLGRKFMLSVENRLEQISMQPESFNKKYRNFREVKIEKFSYMIVYEFFKRTQLIHIAAIYHSKRNPRYKYRKRR